MFLAAEFLAPIATHSRTEGSEPQFNAANVLLPCRARAVFARDARRFLSVAHYEKRRVTVMVEADAYRTTLLHVKARCLLDLSPQLAECPSSAPDALGADEPGADGGSWNGFPIDGFPIDNPDESCACTASSVKSANRFS